MAVGPIPYTAFLGYCEANEIRGDQREDFLWLSQRLDQKYLEWSANRGKSSGVQPADHGKGRNTRNPRR